MGETDSTGDPYLIHKKITHDSEVPNIYSMTWSSDYYLLASHFLMNVTTSLTHGIYCYIFIVIKSSLLFNVRVQSTLEMKRNISILSTSIPCEKTLISFNTTIWCSTPWTTPSYLHTVLMNKNKVKTWKLFLLLSSPNMRPGGLWKFSL